MAYSYAVTVASGSTAAVVVPFPFLSRDHVHVTLDGAPVDDSTLTWVNDGQLTLSATPAAGTAVKVYRLTPTNTAFVSWPAPGTFSAEKLNTVERFLRYCVQEAYDAGAMAADMAEDYLTILEQVADLAAQVAEDANATGIGSAQAVAAAAQAVAAAESATEIAAGSAAAIAFTPAGTISATNVQTALEELSSEKAASTHTHAQSDITGLVSALSTINSTLTTLSSDKAPKASPVFTGSAAKATTPGSSSDTNELATTEWVRDRIDAAASGGWEFIGSQTISSPAAQVVLDAGTTKTYRELYVGFIGLSGSANVDLRAVFSTDNGSTYDTGNNYRYKTYSGGPGTRAYQIVADAFGAAGTITGFLRLSMNFDNCPKPVELGSESNNMGFTYLNYTAVVNAIKLYFASGNVDAGTIVLYGRP